jgi:hypothetical protein
MDFLNHRKGNMVFLLSPLQCTVSELYSRNYKRLSEFEEIEPQSKAVQVAVNSHEENFLRLLSGFSPRIRRLGSERTNEGSRGRQR